MSREIVFGICILSSLLLISVCQASSVTRTFSNTSAIPGQNITVNLTVSITSGQDTYYAIDETYPSGWTVVSTNGDLNQSGHVKWVITLGAASTNHTYLIRAPASGGTYTFSGLYMFNTTYPNELLVLGQAQVTLGSTADVTGNGCVDISDMSAVAANFGMTFSPPPPYPVSDITQNGVVDVFDLVVVGKDFGVGC